MLTGPQPCPSAPIWVGLHPEGSGGRQGEPSCKVKLPAATSQKSGSAEKFVGPEPAAASGPTKSPPMFPKTSVQPVEQEMVPAADAPPVANAKMQYMMVKLLVA